MNILSILIVNYRSERQLADCLHSLEDCCIDLDYEIQIVNNDQDGKLSEVREIDNPRVKIIQNQSNRGFSAAVNQGYYQSCAPFVMLLNPDVRVERGSVETLVTTLENYQNAGIVMPQLRNPDGTLQYSCRRFYTVWTLIMRRAPLNWLFSQHPNLKRHLMLDWNHQTLFAVDWGLGAAMLIRRNAVGQEDLLDERFFLYFEDVDLCKRMWQKSWKVLYNPAAYMIHDHRRESAAHWWHSAKRHHFLSLVKFLWKHHRQLGTEHSN